jgi:hypothetical protein
VEIIGSCPEGDKGGAARSQAAETQAAAGWHTIPEGLGRREAERDGAEGMESRRRRSPRVATSFKGSLTGRRAHSVAILDLSESGCLVRCGQGFDLDSILDLSLQVGDEAIAVKVRVMDSSIDGSTAADEGEVHLIGLEFLAVPAGAAKQIRRVIEDELRGRGADAPAE